MLMSRSWLLLSFVPSNTSATTSCCTLLSWFLTATPWRTFCHDSCWGASTRSGLSSSKSSTWNLPLPSPRNPLSLLSYSGLCHLLPRPLTHRIIFQTRPCFSFAPSTLGMGISSYIYKRPPFAPPCPKMLGEGSVTSLNPTVSLGIPCTASTLILFSANV